MTVRNHGQRAFDRVALVTGTGGTCGGAVAKAWAAEGGKVAMGYNTSEAAAAAVLADIEAAGGSGHVMQVDVSDETSVTAFVDDAALRYGRLDVVVNAAGRWTADEDLRFADVTTDAFARLLDVDLLGTFRVCKAALAYLRAAENGSIVNFTTAHGPGINPDNPVDSLRPQYLAAKGAVRALTIGLARDLAPDVRVNAVAPGPITLGSQWGDEVLATTPLRRAGDPSEIAEAVMYFASDGAAFTTGQVLEVSGGWSLDW
jgi:3-oxoacyl-[acyl-carrier protein] reductase